MKKDRELIQLARANVSLDLITARFETTVMVVLNAATRLGIEISALPVKRDPRRKTMGKP
jgi:hypothetical protein